MWFAARITALIFSIICALTLIGASLAHAEEKSGEWWNTPAVRACCSEADAVYADDWTLLPDGSVKARVTGGGPQNHAWAPIGREYIVPPEKVVREPGNPTGRPLLFLAAPHNAQIFNKQPFDLWCFAMGPMI